jgi:hypothetical protein
MPTLKDWGPATRSSNRLAALQDKEPEEEAITNILTVKKDNETLLGAFPTDTEPSNTELKDTELNNTL